MRRLLLALLAGLLPAFASERTQRFAFALPETEGRISLGVFDSVGKLVRTLCVGAAESDFVVGLNGLIGVWDGNDDFGKPLPAGKYQIQGFVVGATLKAEGIAYHFNDWITDEKSPHITRIEDFSRRPDGFVVLAKVSNSNNPIVFRYDQERGFLWTNFLSPPGSGSGVPATDPTLPANSASPVSKRMLAISTQYVAAWSEGALHVLRLDDGTAIKTKSEGLASANYLAADDVNLFVGAQETIVKLLLPGLDRVGEEKTPLAFDTLAVDGQHQLGASSIAPEVWEFADAEWKKLPVIVAVSEIALGLRGTFWVVAVDAESQKPFVGQFDKAGEFLRAYRGEFSPVMVSASTIIEEIAVLETTDSKQRLRVLSLVKEEPESADSWAIAVEKTMQDCRRFGIVDGRLVADAGSSSQTDQFKIPLATGGLTTASGTLTLRIAFDDAGLWLETSAGLRLAFLASQPNVRRVALLGPRDDSLTVYAGDDAVVAEYDVRGLRNFVEIDIGEVELP